MSFLGTGLVSAPSRVRIAHSSPCYMACATADGAAISVTRLGANASGDVARRAFRIDDATHAEARYEWIPVIRSINALNFMRFR